MACEVNRGQAAGGGGGIDPVGLKNIAGTTIDPATEPKQDSIITLLTSLDGKDYATQTTLAALLTCCQAIDGNTDGIEALLTSLDGKDYSTSAKQDSIITLLTSLDGKDYATQTTLAALLTCCQAVDANTDTLEALITSTNTKLDTINTSVTGNSRYGNTESYAPVTAAVADTLILAANTSRKEAIIWNTSNKPLWLTFDTVAAEGKGWPIPSNTGWIEDVWQGEIRGFWESGAPAITGQANVTEVTT